MLTLLVPALAGTLTADLDRDGQPETIEARFDRDGHLLVEFEEVGRSRTLDLGTFVDIMGLRTEVVADLVPAEESGVPMLRLHVPRGEYCGSGNDWVYVSYVLDTPKQALTVGDFSDAPVWSSVETTFDAARKRVKIVQTYGEGERTRGRDTQKLRFVDGVYK